MLLAKHLELHLELNTHSVHDSFSFAVIGVVIKITIMFHTLYLF